MAWPDRLTNEQLECLILWPKGTVGWFDEAKAVCILNQIASDIGYGRLAHLANQLEKLWRNPDDIAAFEKYREDQLKRLEECHGMISPAEDADV